MKLYNRYIFYKTSLAFLGISSLLVVLIWFSRTIPFMKYLTENGVELQQFFLLFVLILPWLLLFIIPVSLFVAVLVVYNRMIINNEIAILKAAGLTKLAISRSIFALAIIVVVFCYFISLFLMPYANKQLREARMNFEDNYSNLSFSKGTFEVMKKLTIYVKEKNDKNEVFGILLHDNRSLEYSITITAKSGRLSFEHNDLLLYMENGTVQRLNYAEKKSEILNFDDYVFNLSENSSSEVTQKRWKANERYISELINPNDDSGEKEIAKYKSELHQRLTYPLMSIVLAIIASAAILRGNFSRYGNGLNIFIAIVFALLFLTSTMTIYTLLETKIILTWLLYFNFISFIFGGIYVLNSTLRKFR